MAHNVLQWPSTVYPGEVDGECPEAREVIDALILRLRTQGPSPVGYRVKTLGAKMGGLWQINLKVEKRQIRVLYAPYGPTIVLFRIHKKGSPQEQTRAYTLATERKREYDATKKAVDRRSHARDRIRH
jgi:hypothetical protein